MYERVNIIILNWNGTNDTIACLKSLKENKYANYKIIIVDNGSDPESISGLIHWCENNFSQIVFYDKNQAESGGKDEDEKLLENTKSSDRLVFVKNNENLGFAAGNNVALRYIQKRNSEYAMLLNNDTIVEKNALSILMRFLITHKEYTAVTPQIRYFEPNNIIWNCGGKITWFGNRKYYYAGKHISNVSRKSSKRITFITGCALLFKPQITGILTEKFFFGEEDFEFSMRQKRLKNNMACIFPSIIYHKVSASADKLRGNILGSVYLHYLSRLIDNKHYSSKNMFRIKKVLNLSYVILVLRFKHQIGFKQIAAMIRKLLKELKTLDRIDRDYYLRFIKEDFSS